MPPEDMSIDRLELRINAPATGDVKVGAYSMGADKMPANLLAENTADLSTAVGGFLVGAISPTPVRLGVPIFLVACYSGTPQPTTFNGLAVQSGGFAVVLGSPAGESTVWTGGTLFSRYTRALTYVVGSSFFPATFGPAALGRSAPGGTVFAVRKAV